MTRRTGISDIQNKKSNWVGRNLRRNCFRKPISEGKMEGGMEVTGRRGR